MSRKKASYKTAYTYSFSIFLRRWPPPRGAFRLIKAKWKLITCLSSLITVMRVFKPNGTGDTSKLSARQRKGRQTYPFMIYGGCSPPNYSTQNYYYQPQVNPWQYHPADIPRSLLIWTYLYGIPQEKKRECEMNGGKFQNGHCYS
ncbi:hypothetical protein Fcan01_27372 [Folsomia candida]|uniref:Uncharacterized protein n=1 Tax=Folsomia candida TaxID=158441 RepID=A0A226CZ47_FOLCA|nr:hypothetical protein Fcan01_27372 [Folsomia candida]